MSERSRAVAGQIGLLLFLATELMFFAGLLSAYWVLRNKMGIWPPPGQPRLPAGITGLNTTLFLISGLTIYGAERAAKRGCHPCLMGWLGLTLLFGLFFLGLQGYEWLRLISFGLTTTHNIYGGLFYIVIGSHALHVIAALAVLLVVALQAARGRYTVGHSEGLTLCRMYWTFVVLIWPLLYGVLYF